MSEDVNLHTENVGCQCSACAATGGEGLNASMDHLAGGTYAGKPIWDVNQVAEHLNRTGADWFGTANQSVPRTQAVQTDSDLSVINFGFHVNQASLFNYGYVFNYMGGLAAAAEYRNFTPFSEAQKASARSSIELWDDLIAVSFAETPIAAADIAFSNLTSAPTTQAYAYLPGGPVFGIASLDAQANRMYGDVWISLSQASNQMLGFGEYGAKSIMHEIGHALGLSHPGGYNAGQAGGPITYAKHAEYAQDSRMYTIMSYFDAEFTGGGHIDWSRLTWVQASTPLLHDIAAIQAIYGADLTTRTGDTVYGFNSTAGKDVYDFTKNTKPVLSIYDAGGDDTLDVSGFVGNSKIDLNPGAFSSAGGSGIVPLAVLKEKGLLPQSYTEAQYAALRAAYNALDGMLKDNISIAYNTIVENAVGGVGNDTIIGNAVGNKLSGNDGDDVIEGRDGDDVIDGGAGKDTMRGGVGNDLFFVSEAGDVVSELAGEGTDTVRSSIDYVLVDHVEDLILTGSALDGTGNALDNVITGNALGNRLKGEAGNDVLIGGDGVDHLVGGAGADIFVAEINSDKVASKDGLISLDLILDFEKGVDKIDVSDLGAFTWKGHAANKDAGDLSIKTFGNMNAAEKALGIDIDGVDGDSPFGGQVTVVFGNTDGGAADFALVVLNTPSLGSDDFIFAP